MKHNFAFLTIINTFGGYHLYVFCYRGEEHCEEVDGGLCDVVAFDGHHNGRQEEEIADCEQESCNYLPTV